MKSDLACSLAVAVGLGVGALGPPAFGAELSTGKEIYHVACASCHGPNLEGGNAQSLVDAVWQFGSKESHIFRNVKYGIADYAMPSFEEALSDSQIKKVIEFILTQEEESGSTRPPPPEKLHTLDYEIGVEVWAEGLDIPWALAFANEELALVTERPGSLRRVVNQRLEPEPVRGVPEVLHEGQGGLLDVAVHPDYSENGWIYLAYSHALDEAKGKARAPAMTRLVRGRINGNQWTDQETIFEAPAEAYLETRHHYGCRIAFDHDGYLYFSIGDRGMMHHAQDPGRPNGKVHRILPDGRTPPDNPFANQSGAVASLFTMGNRNPQGLGAHPVTGEIWATEHGPMGGDELNLVRRGVNYGWPEVTFGRNYDGGIITPHRSKPGLALPALYWKPSIAVCGMDFVRGDLFPRWKNKLLVSALKYEEIRLLDIEGARVIHQEIVLKNAGRVRDVVCGPDGAVYAVLNGPDMILKLTPIRDKNVEPDARFLSAKENP